MNQFKPIPEPIEPEEPREEFPETPPIEAAVPKKTKKLSVIAGVIHKDQIIAWMPFIFFLSFLVMVYISNSYYSERNIRKIDKITYELKELRTEYITSKSDLMFKSKQSEMAAKLEATGLKESVVPPKKIVVQE
jgi:hypothetical protein